MNKKWGLHETDLVVPLWNHGNGERNFIFQFIDCSTGGALIQRQNLFFQLVDAFFQQKQLTRVQVDLHDIKIHRNVRLSIYNWHSQSPLTPAGATVAPLVKSDFPMALANLNNDIFIRLAHH